MSAPQPDSPVPESATISKRQIEALHVLINCANALQKTGALSLDEAAIVCQAVRCFVIDKETADKAKAVAGGPVVNPNTVTPEPAAP